MSNNKKYTREEREKWEKTRKNREMAMKDAIKKGETIGRLPLGYSSINYIAVPNEKAQIVLSMFEYVIQNKDKSINQIKKNLLEIYNEAGNIIRILTNQFYNGKILIGRRLYPHQFKLFIPEDLFHEVNEFIKEQQQKNKQSKTPFGRIPDHIIPYLYRDLIKCEICQRFVRPDRLRGKFIYYKCRKSNRNHKIIRSLREDRITKDLMLLFRSLGIHENIFSDPFKMKIAFQLLLKSAVATNFGVFEYELKPGINKTKIAAYLNYYSLDAFSQVDEKPIEYDHPILKLCLEAKSIDAICEELKLELNDVQMQIFTLQLEDKIEETITGLWKTKK